MSGVSVGAAILLASLAQCPAGVAAQRFSKSPPDIGDRQ